MNQEQHLKQFGKTLESLYNAINKRLGITTPTKLFQQAFTEYNNIYFQALQNFKDLKELDLKNQQKDQTIAQLDQNCTYLLAEWLKKKNE